MADRVLQITDGTTTVDFDGANNFHLRWDGWAPAVARRRLSMLGGVGPYADVDETMTISIEDTSVDNIVGHLATLTELIDQAERWALGEVIDPVIIKYRPQDSTQTSALEAVIVGGPGDGGPVLSHQSDFDAVDKSLYLNNITLRFRRRGLWLAPAETVTATAVEQPARVTATFAASHNIQSPVKVTGRLSFGNFAETVDLNDTQYDAYIGVANASNAIATWAATVLAGGNYASTAASTAITGNVLRFTPASTSYDSTVSTVATGINPNARRIGVYASIKSSSASVDWAIKTNLYMYGADYDTRPFIYEPADTNPKWVYLGTLIQGESGAVAGFGLTIKPSTTSGSPTLDIDTVVLADLDNALVVYYPAVDPDAGTTKSYYQYILDHRYLDKADPITYMETEGVSADVMIPYRGNPSVFLDGGGITAVYMATDGADWRRYDDSVGTEPADLDLTCVRRAGYLVPQ